MKFWLKSIFLLGIIIFSFSCQNNEKFESSKWKKGGGENLMTEIRLNMVEDLISSGLLVGMNESEIFELLGSPELVNTAKAENSKFYPVMEKYGWNIDPEELIFLEVKFDQSGIANDIVVYTTK